MTERRIDPNLTALEAAGYDIMGEIPTVRQCLCPADGIYSRRLRLVHLGPRPLLVSTKDDAQSTGCMGNNAPPYEVTIVFCVRPFADFSGVATRLGKVGQPTSSLGFALRSSVAVRCFSSSAGIYGDKQPTMHKNPYVHVQCFVTGTTPEASAKGLVRQQ